MKRDLILWSVILAGPIVWLLSFEANFALAPWACIFQNKLALYLIWVAALVVAAASGLVAWREWQVLRKEVPAQGDLSLHRSQTMALGGVLLSAMFFLVILAQAIPAVVLSACE